MNKTKAIIIRIQPPLLHQFKQKCIDNNTTISAELRNFITNFVSSKAVITAKPTVSASSATLLHGKS